MRTRTLLAALTVTVIGAATACLPVTQPTPTPPPATTTTTAAPTTTTTTAEPISLIPGARDLDYTGAGTRRVLVMGDSITYGGHDALHTALDPTSLLRTFGISGYTAIQFDTNYGATLAATLPDVAVINLGTNDAHYPAKEADTMAALTSLYGRFTGLCVVGVTVNSHVTAAAQRDPGEIARLNAWTVEHASAVADWNMAVDGHPELFATDPQLMIHPTAAGYDLLAGLITDAISRCP